MSIEKDFVEIKGLYWFSAVHIFGQLFFGMIFFGTFVVCAVFYNHFSEIKVRGRSLHPFNFYINFYVTFRIMDYLIQATVFPEISRDLATFIILVIPIALGFYLMTLGPLFTYKKTMLIFYFIVLCDITILYFFASPLIFLVGMLDLVAIFMAVNYTKLSGFVKDKEEWVASVFIAFNFFISLTNVVRPLKNIGALRMIGSSISAYYASDLLCFWIGLLFLMVPTVAYLRYRFSSRIIEEHFRRVTRLKEDNSFVRPASNSGGLTVDEEDDKYRKV